MVKRRFPAESSAVLQARLDRLPLWAREVVERYVDRSTGTPRPTHREAMGRLLYPSHTEVRRDVMRELHRRLMRDHSSTLSVSIIADWWEFSTSAVNGAIYPDALARRNAVRRQDELARKLEACLSGSHP